MPARCRIRISANNQLAISDSFFYADFWYRDEFTAPAAGPGGHVWLNFDGINWKAEVYLNGSKLGRIEGAFTRARFDVTGKLAPGRKNALAVRIIKNATPGSAKEKSFQAVGLNGGALGADNPTYHAAIGWDWIPTIRGRDTGIWNNVHFTVTKSVTLEDPLVSTSITDAAHATVKIAVTLRNHSAAPVSGTLHGTFGGQAFEERVSLGASAAATVRADHRGRSPEALVAGRIRRTEPVQRGAEVRGFGLGAVPGGHPPVHVFGGRRRAEDVDQRAALHSEGRQLGIQRIDAALPRARVRSGDAVPPRHALQHGAELGGADRRGRILRSGRPQRHRDHAGFLAGESLGRAGPGR